MYTNITYVLQICTLISAGYKSMSKSKIINIRISPELKKAAKKVAEEDGRSLSNWITRLMEKEIRKAKKSED